MVCLDDGRVFRRHFDHVRRDVAREVSPREPSGPVISRPDEPPTGALPQPSSAPAPEAAPADVSEASPAPAQEVAATDTSEASPAPAQEVAATGRGPSEADEDEPRVAVEPIRRSSRPRAAVQRMNLYIN